MIKVKREERCLYGVEEERKNLTASSSAHTVKRNRSLAWFLIGDHTECGAATAGRVFW